MSPFIRALTVSLLVASLLQAEESRPWRRHVIDSESRGADGVRFADVNGDGLPDIATGWEQGGIVRVCFNPGPAAATRKWPSVTVGTAADVEDAVCVDVDGDGCIDVLSCCEGKARKIVVHWSPSDSDKRLDSNSWRSEPIPASVDRMMWMFATPMEINGRPGTEIVAGGKGDGAALGWFAAPAVRRNLADWTWHSLRPVGWLMSIVVADMNGDGHDDIVFTDRKGARRGAFWLQNPGPAALHSSWREHPIGAIGLEAMFLQLADVDQDGLQDVVVAVRPRELHWLRRSDVSGDRWQSQVIALPEHAGDAKAVQVADLDQDGRMDLVFSCENAKRPRHGLMWLRAGATSVDRWTPQTLSGEDGVKHDLIGTLDLDGDADLDVITTEETKNLGVIWYENPGMRQAAVGRRQAADRRPQWASGFRPQVSGVRCQNAVGDWSGDGLVDTIFAAMVLQPMVQERRHADIFR